MEKIYKYVSMEDALKILENNSVSLNYPNNYNDPFDSVIDFDEKETEKVLKILCEYYFTQEIINLDNKENLRVSSFKKKVIELDAMMLSQKLKKSKKKHYYYSHFSTLGITNAGLIYASVKKKESLEKLKETYASELTKLKDIRNSIMCSCFSKKSDSILMWAHYGDKHTGVCIEYGRPEKDFYDVKYSKKRCKFNIKYVTRRYLGYLLTDSDLYFEDDKLIKRSGKPFLTKSLDWSYEKEVRCILSKDSKGVYEKVVPDKNGGMKTITLFSMPEKPTKIYIGCKADKNSDDYLNLKKKADEQGIKMFDAKISDSKFKVLLH